MLDKNNYNSSDHIPIKLEKNNLFLIRKKIILFIYLN